MLLINNLSARYRKYKNQIQATFNRVMASGWVVLGPEVKRFEESFASYLGTKYCLGVANGTDAIELALKALGVGAGDRVATAANAGMYTTTALMAIKAEPYYIDVDLDSRGVTLAEVTRAVEAGVKAVVVTHLYGLAIPEIAIIAEYCAKNDISLLEDCAQAHGAFVNGKRIGTFGDAASFSFYPTKNLGALGDGGAVVTDNSVLAENIEMLRQYGWSEKYKVKLQGGRNSRLDELQAAILTGFLPFLDEANARRREIATSYSTQINHPGVTLPHVGKEDYVAHLYVIRSQQRDALREYLYSLKISTDIHYPVPDHRQTVVGDMYGKVVLKNTECLAKEVLTLPCYPEMSNEEVNYVIESINGW